MKKFIIGALLFLVLSCSGFTVPVLASSLPDVEVSIYLDGYPVEGTIIGDSNVNIYKAGSFDSAIDTLVPGTVVTLTAQYAYADGNNYFNIKYVKDGVELYGLVDFYSVEPFGVVIEPEDVIEVSSVFKDFSLMNILEYVNKLWNYIQGLLDFLIVLPDIVLVIFPFLAVEQVELLNFLLVVLIMVSCYFIAKKVV